MNLYRVTICWAISFAFLACLGYSAETTPKLLIDLAKPAGQLRALHGVNNGPVSWGIAADLTNYYKEAGFPSARLHDCHYAGANVVDIHFIFPIFDADPDDPKYYTFAETDAYLAPIIANGTKITYRLGESIESRSRAYSNGGFYVQPPKDFAKWARICVNIIRHYNDGWANGFHYGITHWEVWNEPAENCPGMWPGTLQQYFEMYEATARAIKAYDPALKVGGPATCNIGFTPLIRPFLEYCRDKAVPLDFITWHCYADVPQILSGNAVLARQMFDEYGFTQAESHITEWHPMWYPWSNAVDANELGNPNPEKYTAMREKFDTMRGPKAAAFVASALMLLQDVPLDMANYYTADTNPWGMFDAFGVPGHVYYTFVAFNRLIQTPNRVACELQGGSAPEITACAAFSGTQDMGALLVSNFGETGRTLSIQYLNLPSEKTFDADVLAIDTNHTLSSIAQHPLTAAENTLQVDIPGNAVYLIPMRMRAGQ